MIPCCILSVLSIALTSLCTEYYQVFLAQGLGFGIGASGILTPGFVCAGQWFHQRRGLAVGIVAAGSSLGKIFSITKILRIIILVRRCRLSDLCVTHDRTIWIPWGYKVFCSISGAMHDIGLHICQVKSTKEEVERKRFQFH